MDGDFLGFCRPCRSMVAAHSAMVNMRHQARELSVFENRMKVMRERSEPTAFAVEIRLVPCRPI